MVESYRNFLYGDHSRGGELPDTPWFENPA